jgi:hypothetical protein
MHPVLSHLALYIWTVHRGVVIIIIIIIIIITFSSPK